MGEWALKALVVGFAVWVIWSILQSRYAFEIRIRGGEPSLRAGKVTAEFLRQVTLVCRDECLVRGWIVGVPRGRWVGLRFSRHFPRGAQQRLRNAWELIG